MFSRISSLPSSCFKCQRGLAIHSRPCQPHIVQRSLLPGRRWQSAPALQAEDDSTPQQSLNDESRELQGTGDVSVDKTTTGTRPVSQRSQQGKGEFRRWRPHKAEELGVNVLGKPAEVLILPTRERKIAQMISEEDKGREKVGLQKSLTSESEPVSLKEALKNIESLKSELGKDDHEFSAAQWKEFRTRLTGGFTKCQLEEYLRIALGYSESTPKETYMPSTTGKRNIASKIMLKAWKWKCRDSETHSGDHKSPTASRTIVLDPVKLDYLMLHSTEKLRTLSKMLDVQIDIFRKEKRVRLSGSSEAVKNASSRLSPIIRGINKITLGLNEDLQELFKDEVKSKAILDTLMQKHKVFLQYNVESIIIVGTGRCPKDAVSRDIFILSGKFRSSPQATVCLQQDRGATAPAPAFPDELPGWLTHDKDWFRLVSTDTEVHWDDTSVQKGRREVRKLAENTLKLDRLDPDILARFRIHPRTLTHEYIVDLAQVLFTDNQPENISVETFSLDRPVTESVLVVQPAMLPQVLGKEPFVPVTATEFLNTDDHRHQQQQESVPFQLHLHLKPITQTHVAPPIQLWISGQDVNLGLQQEIKINRACAVLGLWHHNLLLPHRPLDMILRRESKIELLGNQRVEPPKAYLDILQQVGSFLKEAQSSGDATLPPIWKLDISPLLNSKQTEADTKIKPVSALNNPSGKNLTGTNDDRRCTYVLEPPERLDIKSYISTLNENRIIDHILCETEPKDKPRQRQIIRLSAYSLSDIFNDKSSENKRSAISFSMRHKWFNESVAAAYDLATAIYRAGEDVAKVGTANGRGLL